jgi:hypothetical protein
MGCYRCVWLSPVSHLSVLFILSLLLCGTHPLVPAIRLPLSSRHQLCYASAMRVVTSARVNSTLLGCAVPTNAVWFGPAGNKLIGMWSQPATPASRTACVASPYRWIQTSRPISNLIPLLFPSFQYKLFQHSKICISSKSYPKFMK